MKSSKILIGLMVLICVLAASGHVAQATSFAPPLTPAAKGYLQCYAPNVSRKTCSALVAFKADPNGQIRAHAIILVSPNPQVIMAGTTVVAPKAGQLCGTLTKHDFDKAHFTDGQNEMEPMQAGLMRTIFSAMLQTYFDREICGAFVPKGASLLVRPTMDGESLQTDPQRVMWVRPDEGYTVAR